MADFLGYMFFSLLEGISVYALMFYIFRIDFMKYIGKFVIVISIINLQSYFIREDLSLQSIAPIINLVITIFFLLIFIRLPLIGAVLMTITGYLAFIALQTLIIISSDGYLSLSESQSFVWKGYLVQSLTGFIGFGIGWLLYKFGVGFSYEFEKYRYEWERGAIVAAGTVFLVALGLMMYFKAVFTNLLILLLALLISLIYSIKKDASE
ncbi:hypothetical protein [Cohnella silvisoli]|uniref:DUF1275 domain-containing protein n=1 Tax=Cohnella silvisoli TaxID=2873699 RepID=A0ABV1KV16_9BACL|nr:hypothetical protein [Cohnella silvisoli]MCD9023290.1 hypothetical protein [Cohnella silvisoli]